MKRLIFAITLITFLIIFSTHSYLGINKINSTSRADITNNQNRYTDIKMKDEKITVSTKKAEELLKTEVKIQPKENQEETTSLIEEIHIHKVTTGENLSAIADKYNIDIDTLLGANHITNMNRIKPGMKLKILPIKGTLYKLNPGENLWEIAHRFDIKLNKVITANGIKNPKLVQNGRLLILPGAKPKFDYHSRLKQRFIKPVKARISSTFGWRWDKKHEGIDYAVNFGTNIKATRDGKVTYSGWAKGYGKTVIIQHQKGVKSLYAHNSRLLVHSGEKVYRGKVISKSGNTGRSTGPHLHFEIRINGKPVNPIDYLNN